MFNFQPFYCRMPESSFYDHAMTQPLSYSNANIFIIEEDAEVLSRLSVDLQGAGYENIRALNNFLLGVNALKNSDVDVVLFGLPKDGPRGEEILARVTEDFPHAHVLVMAEQTNLESMTALWRIGVKDFLKKPVQTPKLLNALENTLYIKMLEKENLALKRGLLAEEIKNPVAFKDIVTQHHRMKAIFIYMEAIIKTPYPILITGESGTGKELIAKCLHKLSGCSGEFVAVNMAGLDDALFSDVLFGHAKGAYTGAERERLGMLRKAENGFLFLDEIGDMDKNSQLKLLRLLQEREFHPLGSDKTQKTNARFIIATNADLKKKMEEGTFRQDLFYRLNTHSIHLPPLRERMDDIPLLVQRFLEKHCRLMGLPLVTCPPRLLDILSQRPFPGNIRELENLVADTLTRSKDKKNISFEALAEEDPQKKKTVSPLPDLKNIAPGSLPSLAQVEEEYIASVLRFTNHNLSAAAKILGIGYSTLHRKLKNSPSSATKNRKL